MSGRRIDRPAMLAMFKRVADEVAADPDLGANEIFRRVGGRRNDVLRAISIIKAFDMARRSG